MRVATAITVSFEALDATLAPARKSGVTFASGDSKISKDGGSFANTTNLPVEIGSTGRYKLDLTAAETAAAFVHVTVEKTGIIQPVGMNGETNGGKFAAVAAGSNSATTFVTTLTEATTDHWKDSLLTFTTGALAGQVKKISGYNGSTKAVTLASAFTGTPANGDQFVIVNI